MRLLCLAAATICCTATPQSPHDVVPCEQTTWSIGGTPIEIRSCERACAKEPTYESVPCSFTTSGGNSSTVAATFVADGVRGLCLPADIDSPSPVVIFYECD